MSSVKIWLPLFAILAYVVQVTYGLSNYQFWIFLAVGIAVMFITTGLSHSDEMSVGEAAEKGKTITQEKVKQIKSHFASPHTGEEIETVNEIQQGDSPAPVQFITILVDAVYTFIDEHGTINQEMFTLLESYPNHKIILTNAPEAKMDTYNLNDMPYDVFSGQNKPNKSDPLFYTTMLKQFGLTADRVIYFEHTLEAVVSAQSVGIKSYHYDTNKKDLESLKVFLDTNL